MESGDTVTITGAPVFSSANAGVRTILQNTVVILGTEAANYTLSWTNGSGTITPAPLTVTANADAKFVTQADVASYNRVSYAGFVNGETTGVLNLGGLSFTRSNSGTEAAGTYAGVIAPSGITANNGNYSISYVNGDYTIVPANQLLVRVANASTTYGTGPSYSVTRAKYLTCSLADCSAGGSVNTLVDLSGSVVQSGSGNGTVQIVDGVSGTASFILGPVAAQNSTSGWLQAGNYRIGANSIVETSANFSNTLTVVGGLTVDRMAMTANASNVSKTYDGSTSLAGDVTISGLIGSETLAYTGATANSKDVLTAAYVDAITLQDGTNGGLATNYQLPTLTQSGANNTASVTRKALTMTGHSAQDKTFDGLAAALTSLGALNGLVGSETLGVSGVGSFADPNVSIGKTVTIVLALADGTNSGLVSNYSISDATTTANINPQPTTVPPPPPSVPTTPTPPSEVPTPPPPLEPPSDPTGTPTPGGDPTGTPAPGGDPTGTPTPGGDPTGTPAPEGDPSGTPAPGGDPTGTPTPGGDPTGTPAPEGDPSGTPAPGGDPTGTPTPGGDPTGTPAPEGDPISVTLTGGREISLSNNAGGESDSGSSGSSITSGHEGSGFISVRSVRRRYPPIHYSVLPCRRTPSNMLTPKPHLCWRQNLPAVPPCRDGCNSTPRHGSSLVAHPKEFRKSKCSLSLEITTATRQPQKSFFVSLQRGRPPENRAQAY